MFGDEPRYTCFLIGQMTADADMVRLVTLRDQVLEPILGPLGYRVVLPDRPDGSPEIFRKVMHLIDTAEILVADVTDDNANVYYELAARHILGLPYVLVGEHAPRFDLRTLDTVTYEEGRPRTESERIREKLHTAHAAVLDRSPVENPISSFYAAPLAGRILPAW